MTQSQQTPSARVSQSGAPGQLFDDTAPDGEDRVISKIVDTILNIQKKSYKPGQKPRRALHGKSLGLANGVFTVRRLPPDLAIGLFARSCSFSTVARFSNGAMGVNAPDILPNVRGLAIKLYGVEGEKTLPGEEQGTEQDFLLANDPAFFVKEIQHFAHLTAGNIMDLLVEAPGTLSRVIKATTKFVPSLLESNYYTQVPSRFGARACKYALIYQPENRFKENGGGGLPNIFDKDYLRHDLDRRLHMGDNAHFVFCVQFQKAGESISDSTKMWTGDYLPLADLLFPRVSRQLEESDGEDLSFNPARSLAEHEPISWPGRLRRAVYQADSEWRNSHS